MASALPQICRLLFVKFRNLDLYLSSSTFSKLISALSFADQREIRKGMQNLCQTIHNLQVVSRRANAIQENGSLSNVFKTEKHLSDMSPRFRVRWVDDHSKPFGSYGYQSLSVLSLSLSHAYTHRPMTCRFQLSLLFRFKKHKTLFQAYLCKWGMLLWKFKTKCRSLMLTKSITLKTWKERWVSTDFFASTFTRGLIEKNWTSWTIQQKSQCAYIFFTLADCQLWWYCCRWRCW